MTDNLFQPLLLVAIGVSLSAAAFSLYNAITFGGSVNTEPKYSWTEVAPPVTGQRCFLWQPDTYRSPVCFTASSVPSDLPVPNPTKVQ